MKQSPYMASSEFQELMWASAMVQMLERMAETTEANKQWLRKLKTCKTYLTSIIDERLDHLDEKEKPDLAISSIFHAITSKEFTMEL